MISTQISPSRVSIHRRASTLRGIGLPPDHIKTGDITEFPFTKLDRGSATIQEISCSDRDASFVDASPAAVLYEVRERDREDVTIQSWIPPVMDISIDDDEPSEAIVYGSYFAQYVEVIVPTFIQVFYGAYPPLGVMVIPVEKAVLTAEHRYMTKHATGIKNLIKRQDPKQLKTLTQSVADFFLGDDEQEEESDSDMWEESDSDMWEESDEESDTTEISLSPIETSDD